MIIGLDAGALSINDEQLRVGVWRITYNLLKEVGKQDKKNSYRLYSFLPIEQGILKDFGPQMTNIILPQKGWFKVWLPLELKRHPVDLFLGLSQALPSFLKKSIGFIYDLGFLNYPDAYPDSYEELKKLTQYAAAHSSHIITISKASASDIEKHCGISKEKITICYPGVDSRFTPKGEKYSGKDPYFLFVGALKRGKNIPLALAAFDQFLKRTKKIYDFLIVGGDYWPDPAIDETINRLHLNDRVKRLGFVPDRDLPKYYRGATALIYPSLSEGFCLPVAEAMACGCPVAASNIAIFKEIVGEAGILVNDFNESTWVKALQQIAENSAFRNTLIKKGQDRAKNFSWQTFSTEVLEVIRHEQLK